jgi:ubiquinone/menaquinone biosynthesis C-methylase UbiE
MGIILKREKRRHFLLSVIYRLSKLPFLKQKTKFKLFLDLEWIFDRLAHEKSFKLYSANKHPIRLFTTNFIFQYLTPEQTVLDLGCKYGDIAYILAEKAKKVVGIDFNAVAIETAKTLYAKSNLVFEVGDALHFLEKNTEKFDVLILSHILEHLDNPKELIIDFKPFVEYMYIEVPDFDKSYLNHYRKDFKFDLIYTDTDHVAEYDRIDMVQLLKECKLEIIASEYRFGLQKHWCKVTSL